MALGRLTLAVTWLTLAPQWSEAQQQRDCFTSSSVVGAVLGTFFATAIAAALLSALLFAIYKRRVANQSTLSNYLCTTSFHPVSVSHPSAFQSTHLNPLISIRPFQSTHFNPPISIRPFQSARFNPPVSIRPFQSAHFIPFICPHLPVPKPRSLKRLPASSPPGSRITTINPPSNSDHRHQKHDHMNHSIEFPPDNHAPAPTSSPKNSNSSSNSG